MQNKGIVICVAVLLTLASIFYLSFSFATRYYDSEAAKIKDPIAQQDYKDSVKYLGVYSYQNCLETQIGLGLDLKGGMNVILEISVPDVIENLADHKTDAGFTNAMKEARAQEEANGGDFVSLFINAYHKSAPGHKLAEVFATQQLQGKDCGKRMPLYVRPDKKVSAQDLKEDMRDEYQDTPLDMRKRVAAGPWETKLRHGSLRYEVDSVTYWYERPTATQQTAWSFVAQMRGYADPKVGGIFWFGVDDAACSMYVPIYSRILTVPECFAEGNGDLYTYSPTSAWWTFNVVANWAYTKYCYMKPEIEREQSKWDEKFNSQIATIDEQAARMSEEARVELGFE